MVREITVGELAEYRASGGPLHLLDVREDWERGIAKLDDHQHIPLGELPGRVAEVKPPAGALLVVYCHHGRRSIHGAAALERAGLANPLSLAGGIEAWSQEIDPSVPAY